LLCGRPPPPGSPRFPYTTLFRSAGGVVDWDANGDVGGVVADAAFRDGLVVGFLDEEGVGDELEAVGRPGEGGVVGEAARLGALVGRKSTRLNSSHGSTSSAVSCL